MPPDELQLLRDYAATRSQQAFAALVARYVDLVYSAARRQCRGDAHLAEDVTQAVFIILADKAAVVPADRPLSAWLLKTCGYCAANARRSKTHRDHYERRAAQMARQNEPALSSARASEDDSAWDDLAPMLDEGMNKLRPQDRDALLLKFFEKKSMRQIGDALGISEEAAGKRVARAVERLRDFFRRRGVAVSAAALPVLLMANAAHAAPAGMVSAVVATTAAGAGAAATATATAAGAAAGTAGAGTGSAAAVAKGALAVMAAEKAKALAVAAAAVVLGVGTTAVVIKSVINPVANRNRQVAVANAPASAAAAAPATSPVINAWPIRFRDGTVVELLGLNDASAPEPMRAEWWTLDGSKTPRPAEFTESMISVEPRPGWRTIQLLLRFRNLPPGASRAIILRPNAAGSTTAISNRPGADAITHHVTRVPADQQTADILIGLGVGPWQSQTIYDAAAAAAPSALPVPPDAPRVAGVTQQGSTSVVRATLPPRVAPTTAPAAPADPLAALRDEYVVAVTDTGAEVRPTSTRVTDGARAEYVFPLPPPRLRTIVWRSRPFTFMQANNVSLRRMQLTNVRVTELKPPGAAPVMPAPTAASAR